MSLATGADLTPDTWADFVARLHHDCVGDGVHDHYTADAIFIVQARRLVFGLDSEFSDNRAVIFDGSSWFSPAEYWDDCDDDERAALDAKAGELLDGHTFLRLESGDQWELLAELPEHTVTCWFDHWEYVNAHFTLDAAEAFIRRKKHDYRDGLRVYVDAQVHCWEYNAIKAAILDGRLSIVDPSDLRRIAACLEICEGLSTEVLEVMDSYAALHRIYQEHRFLDRMTAQRDQFEVERNRAQEMYAEVVADRDQLLAALEEAADWIDSNNFGGDDAIDLVGRLRAIAAAKAGEA